jgi:hypothetical protein
MRITLSHPLLVRAHEIARHRKVRRAILSIWLPSSLMLIITSGMLLADLGESPQILPFTSSVVSNGLFAAAPPKGAVLGDSVIANADQRTAILSRYLRDKNSPMAGSAGTFTAMADKYRLDWRLLVAIAGKESTFGKRIPPGSYNAWGWGIPTGAQSGIAFSSWDTGIETVARGLRTKYFDRGADTLAEIERSYTPPSAADPRHPWRTGVGEFMAEIENYR